MKFLFISICTLFLVIEGFCQTPSFVSPVNIPLVLNGNFGEIRSNHFHAGIDIKTNGATGLPVFSISDGVVSRISVSATGYGKTLYIDHPSGYTSVYAHLDRFIPEIEKWVKEQQYQLQRFEVNLEPSPTLFRFSKGEQIAFSGNTGSSAGPHLHFEIRKT
ncbi:MAG TPA: M23 family metallopeptidase, partial [Prolixibacteraceae bacterium]|nr:M23 family metallopeptidase [Prolixibacteraceae bacterium]